MDPLAPLSTLEIENSVKILRTLKNLDHHYRFITIQLAEPDSRTDELIWSSPAQVKSKNYDRSAFMVIIRDTDGTCWEATVCISQNSVVSFKQVENVQAAYTPEDYATCETIVKTDPKILEALKKRGIHNVEEVMVDLWASGRGFLGENDNPALRIAKPILYARDESDTISYGYGRPIEGLTPVIDLNKKTIIEIEDLGVKPVLPKMSESKQHQAKSLSTEDFPPLKPLDIVQREGPSFVLHDNRLRWQGWDLRIGFNAREGLTLHTLQIWDREQNRFRKVLYRASCAEMVVPYGDSQKPVYRRCAFDVGEEGLGFNANSLELGCDCLGAIQYLDAVVNTTDGKSRTIKNAICIHEEDYGILWKHTDWRSGNSNVARCRRLVISFFCTVANYDYGFYWYFYQDGVIQFEVKLTGLLLTTGGELHQKAADITHGIALKPGLSAPFHQHFFNVRLDTCVDGFSNCVQEVNVEPDLGYSENLQGNAFRRRKTIFAREFDAQRHINSESGRYWQIINRNSKNAMGDNVSYRLAPGENSFQYAHPYAPTMQRAGFVGKHLWVTPYHPDEKYPTSAYPNKANFSGEGLPNYTRNNRPITDTSVVVWYTLGVLHIPRVEEWPIMSVVRASFSLLPEGFFNGNPSTYLKKENPSSEASCDHSHHNVTKSKV